MNIKMYQAQTSGGKEIVEGGATKCELNYNHYGEVKKDTIKDVTAEYPIDVDRLADELMALGWGQPEISAIKACVEYNYGNCMHYPENSI